MVGGSAGFSLGPLLAATLLAPAGLRSTVWLLIPSLLVAALLLAVTGRVDRVVMAPRARPRGGELGAIAWAAVLALGSVIVLRAWINSTLGAFLPLLYSGRQEAPALAGEILFLLFFTEGFGTALGGWVADRIGMKPTLVGSFLLLGPLLHLFLAAGGLWAAPAAVVVGLFLGASVSITLVAAQDVLPARTGMASGIAIALGNIVGGIGVAVQGLLADHYGLELSVEALVLVSLVTAAAALGVRGRPAPS
jgi:FSR family fosmidomycin resistance protein-like MFS transporter